MLLKYFDTELRDKNITQNVYKSHYLLFLEIAFYFSSDHSNLKLHQILHQLLLIEDNQMLILIDLD